VNASSLDRFLEKLPDAKQRGKNWQARCPAHEDKTASLSVSGGNNGGVLIKCFAGCDTGAVVAALGLTLADLMPPNESAFKPKPSKRVSRLPRNEKWEDLTPYDYTDVAGTLLYQSVRYRTASEAKKFTQRRPDGKGGWHWNMDGIGRVLYRLPAVLDAASRGETIFVAEGEKDADNLHRLGIVATTNVGGAGKWQDIYSESLRGAGRVIMLPDNDPEGQVPRTGHDHGQAVAASCRAAGVPVSVVNLPTPDIPKGDVSDWLNAGGTKAELLALAASAPDWTPEPVNPQTKARADTEETDEDADKTGKAGAATLLVHYARENCDLWKAPDGVTYGTVPAGGHREHCPIEGTGFRRFLSGVYFDTTQKAPSQSAVQTAVQTLDALAARGQEHPVYTRKADTGAVIYIDLCNEARQSVEVTADGWRVVDEAPVRFLRRKGMLALPTPERGGNVRELREFVNAPAGEEGDELFILMIAWLLAALGKHTPYPILNVSGEQGSAKSTTTGFLRDLADPNTSAMRAAPKDEQDLAIAATNGFVVCYDNLSGIPNWLSDALCRVSTGAAFATRKLHTDSDEALFYFKSPILLNGIGEASTRGDFMERSILLSLPTIPETRRKMEAEVVAGFAAARARIFGALLTIVAAGLQNLPDTRPAQLPRMADFARWITACEPACPWKPGAFIEAYRDNQAAGVSATLESDQIAPLLLKLINGQETPGYWLGTAGELLAAIRTLCGDDNQKSRLLPANPRTLSVAIKRIAPALRSDGVSVTATRSKSGRFIELKRVTQTVTQNAPVTQTGDAKTPGFQIAGDAMTQMTQKYPHSYSPTYEEEKGGNTATQHANGDKEINVRTLGILRHLRHCVTDEPEQAYTEQAYTDDDYEGGAAGVIE